MRNRPHNSRVSAIKKSQKESLIRKEIGADLLKISADDPILRGLTVSRVELSDDRHYAIIYLYIPEGEAVFNQKLEELKLFKPSLRKALANALSGRFVPDIVFKFDHTIEKQMVIERALDTVKEELKNAPKDE